MLLVILSRDDFSIFAEDVSIADLFHRGSLERFMRRWATTIAIFFASVAPASAQTLVGQPICDFSLANLNGQFLSPGQFKGKILGIFLLGHD